jgi:hypothetical protein
MQELIVVARLHNEQQFQRKVKDQAFRH